MYLNTSATTCREASGSKLASRQSRFSCPIHHPHLIRIRMVCRIPPGRVSIRASSAVVNSAFVNSSVVCTYSLAQQRGV